MAYSLSGLSRIGSSASGPSLWSYTSDDAIATVNTAGYFNDASDVLKVRDTIRVTDANTPTTHDVIVLSNAAGVVDVSDGLQITETDTD